MISISQREPEQSLAQFLSVKCATDRSVQGRVFEYNISRSDSTRDVLPMAILGDSIEEFRKSGYVLTSVLDAAGEPEHGIGRLLRSYFADPMWRHDLRYSFSGGFHRPKDHGVVTFTLATECTPYFLMRLSRERRRPPLRAALVVQSRELVSEVLTSGRDSPAQILVSRSELVSTVWKATQDFSSFEVFDSSNDYSESRGEEPSGTQ